MSKLIPFVAAISLVTFAQFVSSIPAFAQKESCQAYCVKRCEVASSKGWCQSQCVPACLEKRSKK